LNASHDRNVWFTKIAPDYLNCSPSQHGKVKLMLSGQKHIQCTLPNHFCMPECARGRAADSHSRPTYDFW